MNNKMIVNLTNKIALAFVVILVYWVFVFSMMSIFDFKIFRQNMTEAFAFSVLGIMAILCGSVIINIMLNLTRIADKQQNNATVTPRWSLKWLAVFILSFPLLFALLYAGDWATKKKKERFMIAAANTLIDSKASIIQQLSQYQFNRKYLHKAQENIYLLSHIDKHFPAIRVLVRDDINQETVILSVNRYTVEIEEVVDKATKNPKHLQKIDFIYSTTAEERQYLLNALSGKEDNIRYEAHKSNYKLYYPVHGKNGNIVILLSDYQRYGKFGS